VGGNPKRKLWESYRKKIASAQAESHKRKTECWLPTKYEILGVELIPLTLEKFLLLDAIQSPVLRGSGAGGQDIINFLWICSKQFEEDAEKLEKFRQVMQEKRANEKVFQEIEEYLNDSFFLSTSKGDDSDEGENFIASIIDLLASQYSWRLKEIMQLPLTQIFQLCGSISKRLTLQAGGTYVHFDPITDEIKAEYLRKVREMN